MSSLRDENVKAYIIERGTDTQAFAEEVGAEGKKVPGCIPGYLLQSSKLDLRGANTRTGKAW